LTIYLPVELIDDIQFTLVDGEKEPESIRFKIGNITQMTVPLNQDSKEINFVGAKVIPEFGSIAVAILVISIVGIIVLTSTKKFQINLLR